MDVQQPGRRERPREFYTVSQLAELLRLNEMTIYRMVKRGALPCYVIGRTKRFKRGEVDEFLESCRSKVRRKTRAKPRVVTNEIAQSQTKLSGELAQP
jgi:excisionase family DNA binding protein